MKLDSSGVAAQGILGNWGYLEPIREINDYESDTGKGKAKNYSRWKSGERVAYYGYLCKSIYGRGRKVTTDGWTSSSFIHKIRIID